MLKIEVIKFEAQDVITTSVAEPAKCTCSPEDRHLRFTNDGTSYWDHGDCRYTGDHNCKADEPS